MANYNTFVVIDSKNRKVKLVTSSARKAKKMLTKGIRIEVWNENSLVDKSYFSDNKMKKYISDEKEYIAKKQKAAEKRNKRSKKDEN
jgi:hypothetical protein